MTTDEQNQWLLSLMGGEAGMAALVAEIRPPEPKLPVSALETARLLASGQLKGVSIYVWQTRMQMILKLLDQANDEVRRLKGLREPE